MVGPRLEKNASVRISKQRDAAQSVRLRYQVSKVSREKQRERERGPLKVLYPSDMFIGGIGLQQPHSPVLGGILGNVVFCLNMAATCSTYNPSEACQCMCTLFGTAEVHTSVRYFLPGGSYHGSRQVSRRQNPVSSATDRGCSSRANEFHNSKRDIFPPLTIPAV